MTEYWYTLLLRNTSICLNGNVSVRRFGLFSHCSMLEKETTWRFKQYGLRLAGEQWLGSSFRIESRIPMTLQPSLMRALNTNLRSENRIIHILSSNEQNGKRKSRSSESWLSYIAFIIWNRTRYQRDLNFWPNMPVCVLTMSSSKRIYI